MMKKVLGLLLILAIGLSLGACSSNTTDDYGGTEISDVCEYADGMYEIAFIADDEDLNKHYYNSEAWSKIKSFASENDITYKYYMTEEINTACSNGAKVVIAADTDCNHSLSSAADEFEDINFILLTEKAYEFDDDNIPRNLSIITFNDFEAGYIAGYAALIEGYSNFGLVEEADGDNLLNREFAYGIVQGINDGAAEFGAIVTMNYILESSGDATESSEVEKAFKDWFDAGYECMFICGDEIGQFMYDLADAGNGVLVGTHAADLDNHENVITAISKDFGAATDFALKKVYENKWNEIGGHCTVLGMDADGLYLPTDDWRFENFTLEQYNSLCDKLKNDVIVIDNQIPADIKTVELTNLIIN